MKNRQDHPFAIVLPLSALVVTIALLLNTHPDALRSQTISDAPSAGLAVEHVSPLTLTIRMSAGKREGIVELSTDGTETAAISVPSAWQRREVRGAALDAVSADPPSMGFSRWHVPPGVTVSFRVIESPSLMIRNPSGIPLLVLGKKVNVLTGQIEEKSVLVKDGAASL